MKIATLWLIFVYIVPWKYPLDLLKHIDIKINFEKINLNTKKDFVIYDKCVYLLGEILLDILINVFQDQPSINVF